MSSDIAKETMVSDKAAALSTTATNAKPSHDSNPSDHDNGGDDVVNLPPGWKYKQISIAGFKLPWYASPSFQLGMVAFVCFMCPGMFNALGGLGGGGKVDPTLVDNMVCVPLSTLLPARRLDFQLLTHV